MFRPRGAPRGARSVPTFAAVLLALAFVLVPAASAQPALDIDTADAAALAAALPGIGPVKARRIVEYRERHGPFGTLDALEAVKGIGPATLERIRAHLAGRPPTDPGPVSGPSAAAFDARSTTELERAARAAVQAVVIGARRDAERVRAAARPSSR